MAAVRIFVSPPGPKGFASLKIAGPKIAMQAKIQMSETMKATQNGAAEGRRFRLDRRTALPGSFSLAGVPRGGRALDNSDESSSTCRSDSRRLARRSLRGSPVFVAIHIPLPHTQSPRHSGPVASTAILGSEPNRICPFLLSHAPKVQNYPPKAPA